MLSNIRSKNPAKFSPRQKKRYTPVKSTIMKSSHTDIDYYHAERLSHKEEICCNLATD
jgi:hypothetical protein